MNTLTMAYLQKENRVPWCCRPLRRPLSGETPSAGPRPPRTMTPPAPCSSEVLLRNVTSCFGKDLAVDTLLAVSKWDSEDPPLPGRAMRRTGLPQSVPQAGGGRAEHTHPLCVTRHCRRPSFRKMSTTISMGVWSVTVNGLMSRMLRSFSGRGLSAGRDGVCCAKHTRELPTIPSCFFLALSEETEKTKN